MCGIFGFTGKHSVQTANIFLNELHNRGPNGQNLFQDDNITLGHTRLSIIDLQEQSDQPMVDSTNSNIISYNGEIYNYLELKTELVKKGYCFKTNSDTEIILKTYTEYGAECLNHLKGMFAFCIYEPKQKRLFLARDRFGIKPLIYSFNNQQFIFSSQISPLLKSKIINLDLNIESVSDFFQYGSVKQPNTIFNNVFQLKPAHYMQVDLTTLSYETTQYYKLTDKIQNLNGINYNEAIELVQNEFKLATQYHMVSDVEVGAFLSGGVDSSAVVAMMSKISSAQINTFSIGFKDTNEIFDETQIAQKTADFLGTKHTNVLIDDEYINAIIEDYILNMDQPTSDGINTYIVSKETSKQLKVALSGLGGDEIFAGYNHFKTIAKTSNQTNNLKQLLDKISLQLFPNTYKNNHSVFSADALTILNKKRSINRKIDNILKQPSYYFNSQTNSDFSVIQNISWGEINSYLVNTLLRDCDVLSMRHSLEVRPVLLDHHLVELALSLPDSFKVSHTQLKSIFVDSVKDIIPKWVWQREKTGFGMPYQTWLNGNLNQSFVEVINQHNTNPLFTPQYLAKLKKRVFAKKAKKKDWLCFIFMSWLSKMHICT